MNSAHLQPDSAGGLGQPPRRSRIMFGLLLAAGLALRLWYWASVRGTYLYTVPYLDSETYDTWARALVSGDWGHGQPYWMGPLYPHLLALSYAVFGPGSGAAMLAQWGLTLLNVVLVYKIGRRWLGETGALLAAALYSGYGPPVFYAGLRLMETVVTTLLLLIALQTWRAAEHPTYRRWLVLGMLVGLCATARGSALILLPFLPLLLIGMDESRRFARHSKRFWRLGGLLWSGAALAILPVAVRNITVGGDLVLLTSNAGLNLMIGQQTHHEGRFGPVADSFEFDPAGAIMLEKQAGHALQPSQVSRELTRRAFDLIKDDPGAAIKNHLLKAYRFWSGYELPQIYSWNFWRTQHLPLRFFPVPAVALTALGLAGALALRPAIRRQWLILVGGWFLGFLPFFPTMRFRLSVMPLLALSAAAWILALTAARRSRRCSTAPGGRLSVEHGARRAVLTAMAGFVLIAVFWPSWGALDPQHEAWQSHMNMAARAAAAGDRTAVFAAVAKAEQVEPGLAETSYRLGGFLDRMGEAALALIAYEETLRRLPNNPFVLHRRAQMLSALNRHEEALHAYTEAVAADPSWANPRHGQAAALLALDRPAEAEKALRQAAALSPGQPRFRGNLASFLADQGRLEEAVAILEVLTADFPGYFTGWFNLALAQSHLGNRAAAHRALTRAAELPGRTEAERARVRSLRQELRTRIIHEGP
jgi:tetratricopeptide (TPR) repeat protein